MPQPSEDSAMLARFIELPRKPVHVKFQTADLGQPGGNDWTFAAVLTFAPADFEAISAQTKPITTDVDFDRDGYAKRFPWIAAEMGAAPPAPHDAVPFLRSPLNTGMTYPLSGNRVLVILSTS